MKYTRGSEQFTVMADAAGTDHGSDIITRSEDPALRSLEGLP